MAYDFSNGPNHSIPAEGEEQVEFEIVGITQELAEEISTWHYPEPYTMYSLSPQEIPILLDPSNRYFAVVGMERSLIGYCCFGAEARVMGGDYSELEPSVECHPQICESDVQS
jgi:hypothetical protein